MDEQLPNGMHTLCTLTQSSGSIQLRYGIPIGVHTNVGVSLEFGI
jgi:hypothetical protein